MDLVGLAPDAAGGIPTLMTVRDDTMEPTLHENDIVAIDLFALKRQASSDGAPERHLCS